MNMKTVLVSEEEPDTLAAMRDLLHHKDYDAAVAPHALAAAAGQLRPAALLYGMDGAAVRADSHDPAAAAQQLEAEVERRVADRTAELRRANEELLATNSALKQFVYLAAHDLQEPARTSKSYAQLLERNYHENLDERAAKYVGFIADAAGRMQRLTEDLLQYTLLHPRAERLEAVDTATALRAALAGLRAAGDENGVQISYTALPTVWGESELITDLFRCLVGNAIKFRGAADPQITVAAASVGEQWRFAVSDNGIGIEPEYFARIFLPLQKLHTSTEYPGSGIGLARSKKIVEQHGGRIWVESALGAGATFYFTLPAPGDSMAGRDLVVQQGDLGQGE